MSTIIEEYEPSGGSRILLPTFVDAASITASDEGAAAPASNLQNKHPLKTWRGDIPAEVSEYEESSGAVVVSLVDGAAFVMPGAGSGADLSPFARTHKIVLTDSNGNQAWGYLGKNAAAENLITYSEQLQNGAWTKDGADITENAAAAPDGETTADKLVEDANPSTTHLLYRLPTLANNTDYVWSIYAKAGERSRLMLRFKDKTNTNTQTWFDLTAGEVGTTDNDGAGIEDAGDGWFRCWIRQNSLTGATANKIYAYLADADGSVTYNGDGSSGLYLWGAQLEAGTIPGSYAPTAAVALIYPLGCWITSKPGETDGDAWAFIQYGFDEESIASYDVYPVLTWLDVALGQDREINALALVNHNLGPEARILLSLGSSVGAEDVGFGWFPAPMPLFGWNQDAWNQHGWSGVPSTEEEKRVYWTNAGHLRAIYLDDTLEAAHMRIGFWDPENADGYVEAGRLLAALRVAAAKQPIVGAGNRPVDPSMTSYSKGGQGWKDRLPQYREATYQYTYTPGDETYVVWYDFLRRVGTGAPFVFDAFPAMTNKVDLRLNNLLYCEIPQDAIQPVRISHNVRGAVSLQVKECI